MDRVHQVKLNMLVTKYLDNKLFDYIDPWGETLASIAWEIKASCHCSIMATPGQSFLAGICYLTSRQLLTGEFQTL